MGTRRRWASWGTAIVILTASCGHSATPRQDDSGPVGDDANPSDLADADAAADAAHDVALDAGVDPEADASPDADGGFPNTPGDAADADAAAEVLQDAPFDAASDAGPDFVAIAPHVPDGPLCDIPPGYVASGGDPTFIPCRTAQDRFSDRDPRQVPTLLRIVAWNVEFGADYAGVLDALRTRPQLQGADFLLLSEVARHNLQSAPAMMDMARELATELAMDYVFAVEWDRRELPDELGEHGVAVLSKYPLGNPVQIRHVPLNDWYEEDRLYGGRVTLGLDALVGRGLVRLYVSHLDTRGLVSCAISSST